MELLRLAPLLCLLAACASSSSQRPTAQGQDPAPTYPGKCQLLNIEQVDADSDMWTDTAFLVATYSRGAEGNPMGLRFKVRSERADDLRAHLVANPEVFCRPEPGVKQGDAAVLELDVPPFKGASAEPFVPKLPADRGP